MVSSLLRRNVVVYTSLGTIRFPIPVLENDITNSAVIRAINQACRQELALEFYRVKYSRSLGTIELLQVHPLPAIQLKQFIEIVTDTLKGLFPMDYDVTWSSGLLIDIQDIIDKHSPEVNIPAATPFLEVWVIDSKLKGENRYRRFRLRPKHYDRILAAITYMDSNYAIAVNNLENFGTVITMNEISDANLFYRRLTNTDIGHYFVEYGDPISNMFNQ